MNYWAISIVNQKGVIKTKVLDFGQSDTVKSIFYRYEMPNGKILVEKRHVGAERTDDSGAYMCLQDEETGKVLLDSYWGTNQIEKNMAEREKRLP